MVTSIPIATPDLSGNELNYVTDAVQSGWLTHRGKYERLFEEALSTFLGRPTIATSSGTGALHLAMLALGIGPGDEVIIPNLTFAAPASAVLALGARPVLVDVRKDKPVLDWDKVKPSHRTKAIVAVDLFGEPSTSWEFWPVPLENRFDPGGVRNIPIIQDACESFGYTEAKGHYACYSFYGNKVITTGEGGAVTGSDISLCQQYRDGGFDQNYYHEIPGLNYRATNLQAAVGLAQMERITTILDSRAKVLKIYESLGGCGKWLKVIDGNHSMRNYLRAWGIETRPMFWPLHRMPPYKSTASFPRSDWWWKNTICLPVTVTEDQARFIVEKVNEYHDIRRAGNSGSDLAA